MRQLPPTLTDLARPLGAPFFLAIALGLGACHGSARLSVSPPPYTPPAPPPPPVYGEGEPNDTAWLAPWFGVVHPGDLLYIDGHSTDDGSDPQDGLAFSVNGPTRIDFTLFVDDPWTDLDVWVFDPVLNAFVGGFTVPYGDEKGTFWLSGAQEFHLVVVSADGPSWWTLAVEASTTYYGALMADPSQEDLPESLAAYAEPEPPLARAAPRAMRPTAQAELVPR